MTFPSLAIAAPSVSTGRGGPACGTVTCNNHQANSRDKRAKPEHASAPREEGWAIKPRKGVTDDAPVIGTAAGDKYVYSATCMHRKIREIGKAAGEQC